MKQAAVRPSPKVAQQATSERAGARRGVGRRHTSAGDRARSMPPPPYGLGVVDARAPGEAAPLSLDLRPRPPGRAGKAMPEDVRAKMEGALGMDFSGVRVHEGPQAMAMGALAYTQGTDIYFAPGQYQPGSRRGQELLGHELTHVVQQALGRVRTTRQIHGVGVNDDVGLETEANQRGRQAAGAVMPAARGAGASGAARPAGDHRSAIVAQLQPGGVDWWAQILYRTQAERELIASISEGKIGSIYFPDESRIRTTHPHGPKKEAHAGRRTLRFNIDWDEAEAEYKRETLDWWIGHRLANRRRRPAWAEPVREFAEAKDLAAVTPSEAEGLFEITLDASGRLRRIHPSRGVAAKLRTNKQVVSVLEAALRKVEESGIEDPGVKNQIFYDFVRSRLPNFYQAIRRPDEV